MIRIIVIDSTAESRSNLVNLINDYLRADLTALEVLPQISVKPIAPQEIKFAGEIEIAIIGEELIRDNINEVSKIRKIIPNAALLVRTPTGLSNIATLEQLLRLGADDTISPATTPEDFLKKLVVLSKAEKKSHTSSLILIDSAKGGLGITSYAAALAECLARFGKNVVLIDFDLQSQDLSRFLQARPFINENLQLLLEQNRSVTEEFVEQSLVNVPLDCTGKLAVLTPVPEKDAIYDPRSSYARIFTSILSILDTKFDTILVDLAGLSGPLARNFYRLADLEIFLVNNDPAVLYSSAARIKQIKTLLSTQAKLMILQSFGKSSGLSTKVLKAQLNSAAYLNDDDWCQSVIPNSKSASNWPGSGISMLSFAPKKLINAVVNSAKDFELIENIEQARSIFAKLLKKVPLTNQLQVIKSGFNAQKLLSFTGFVKSKIKLVTSKRKNLIENIDKQSIGSEPVAQIPFINSEVAVNSEKIPNQNIDQSKLDFDSLFSKPQIY